MPLSIKIVNEWLLKVECQEAIVECSYLLMYEIMILMFLLVCMSSSLFIRIHVHNMYNDQFNSIHV